MRALLRASRAIDALNDKLGRGVSWLAVAMVLLGAGNALLRYAGAHLGRNLSSNALLEGQWYLFSLLFLLGAGWTLRHDRHVRVDVLFGRLSERARAWIDLAGTALFLLPFCAMGLAYSVPSVWSSIRRLEGSSNAGGLPRYPIKAVLLVAFVLLALQGLSEAVKRIAFLRGLGPYGPSREQRDPEEVVA